MRRTLEQMMAARLERRDAIKLIAAAGVGVWTSPSFSAAGVNGSASPGSTRFTFEEIEHGVSDSHVVAPGYDVDVLIRWGDALLPGAPDFNPYRQTPEGQEKQFGYNNDFVAYMPLDSGSSRHGLLCVNHEFANTYMMFPDPAPTREKAEIELSSVGCSIVEIERSGPRWRVVSDGSHARRITGRTTPVAISGPAAGQDRMKTPEDPSGTLVTGTISNCGGGVTPWGTCLVAEENFQMHFLGRKDDAHREARNQARYSIPRDSAITFWHHYFDRWDTNKILHEPNRFGWIVEIDPYDPASTPVKRTALGRVAHEGAAVHVDEDGRVVVYMADDNRYEYLYRFVSLGNYDPVDRSANLDLLDEGTLSVAVFSDDGTVRWVPLVFGEKNINENNGFENQSDVLIEARSAADMVGATPMDRPEGVAISPTTGGVFVTLSGNKSLKPEETNAVNTRAKNIWGHVLELVAPEGRHAADVFHWEMLVQCGPPSEVAVAASWNAATSAHGWFSGPDNCAFDNSGGLWVCTDQSARWKKASGTADGVWAVETEGEHRATGKMFFRVPIGAEATGPAFTPDDESLFLAVQHPGTEGTRHYEPFGRASTFADPATRWPDFTPHIPPRPAVVAITRRGGGEIGS